ncbi:hypothetical protein BH10BAC2_BH10BAC2_36540 [soil metagenome]
MAGTNSVYSSISVDGNGLIVASGSSYFPETGLTNYMAAKYFEKPDPKNPKIVKIKKWLHRHGFTWQDRPDNSIVYYSIQRSSNGSPFQEISRVVSSGSNQIQSFEDANPPSSMSEYRIGAINTSNDMIFSNTLSINNQSVKIYPNPTKSNLQIEGLSTSSVSTLRIIDMNGNVRRTVTTNGNSFSYNVGQLSKGNYVLVISNGQNNLRKMFIKE